MFNSFGLRFAFYELWIHTVQFSVDLFYVAGERRICMVQFGFPALVGFRP